MMPRVREMFPTGFLSAEDLQGRDVHLTIHSVGLENLRASPGDKEKAKWVVRFEELERRPKKTDRRGLVLNRTNAKQIGKLHGPDADQWKGKRVTLYETECQAFGETVACIRIRPTSPPPKKEGAND